MFRSISNNHNGQLVKFLRVIAPGLLALAFASIVCWACYRWLLRSLDILEINTRLFSIFILLSAWFSYLLSKQRWTMNGGLSCFIAYIFVSLFQMYALGSSSEFGLVAEFDESTGFFRTGLPVSPQLFVALAVGPSILVFTTGTLGESLRNRRDRETSQDSR